MGYIKNNVTTLSWTECIELQDQVKKSGIQQFCNLWARAKDRQIPLERLKWGDEVEYHIVSFKDEQKQAALTAEGYQLITELTAVNPIPGFSVKEEFGSWTAEIVPDAPYSLEAKVNEATEPLKSLQVRRTNVNNRLRDFGCQILSMPNFPSLGSKGFYTSNNPDVMKRALEDDLSLNNNLSLSQYFVDNLTNVHPKFQAICMNYRQRRGRKVDARIPIYQDEKTQEQDIHIDARGFGGGMCCLQVTFESQNVEHARFLHDSFLGLASVLPVLAACTPIYRGRLADQDFRYNVMQFMWDDRTVDEQETGFVPRSRCGGMSHYISDIPEYKSEEANDAPEPEGNPDFIQKLVENGVP